MPSSQQKCCIVCSCCICGGAKQREALADALREYDGDGPEESRYQRMARGFLQDFGVELAAGAREVEKMKILMGGEAGGGAA